MDNRLLRIQLFKKFPSTKEPKMSRHHYNQRSPLDSVLSKFNPVHISANLFSNV